MYPELFLLISAVCVQPSSIACTKTAEAYLKQIGYWNYGEKFSKWASNSVGPVITGVVVTAASYERFGKITLYTGGFMRYNLVIGKNEASTGVTWRLK